MPKSKKYRTDNSQRYSKICLKIMELRMIDYAIIKVVQATHYQGDVRYGTSRGLQCSCMSFMSLSWRLFKSPGLWDKSDLDCILSKEYQSCKFISKIRYLGIEDLLQEFLIENALINVEFLENEAGEITAGHIYYLLHKLQIVFSILGLVLFLLLTITF